MIAVNSLIDSLKGSLSNGSRGVTRTGGVFGTSILRYFRNLRKKLSSKYKSSEGWKHFSGSFGSGEGLYKGVMGSASAKETSS